MAMFMFAFLCICNLTAFVLGSVQFLTAGILRKIDYVYEMSKCMYTKQSDY